MPRLGNGSFCEVRTGLLFCLMLCLPFAAVAQNKEEKPSAAEQPTKEKTPRPVIDPKNVHRAFLITPEQAKERIKAGKEAAEKHKSEKEVTEPFTHATRITRGPQGIVTGEVQCYGIFGNTLLMEAYEVTRDKKDTAILGTFEDGGFTRALVFRFFLMSQPSTDNNSEKSIYSFSSDHTETNVTHVILSDDKGNSFEALSPAQRQSLATSGIDRLPYSDKASDDDTPFPLPTFRPLFSEPRSPLRKYYSRHYQAVYPLFDGGGNPLIKPDVKKITLHIATNLGEQIVDFAL